MDSVPAMARDENVSNETFFLSNVDGAEPIQFGTRLEETIRSGISMDRLAEISLELNPTLIQASRVLDQVHGNYVQVGLYPNPVVAYSAGEVGDDGTAGKHGGFVQQRIVTANKLGLDQAVVGSEADQAYYGVEQQRQRILNDVRSLSVQVLALQQQIVLDQTLVAIGAESMATAERLLGVGEVSRADLLQARVEYNTARLQLDTVRAQYLGAWRRLAALIGDPELPPTRIIDSLEKSVDDAVKKLEWSDSLARILELSPELAQARAGVRRARNDLARQQVQPIPDIEFSGGAMYNAVNGDTLGTAQLAMVIPIFDRNQGRIASASASVASEMANVRRLELDLQNRLAAAMGDYDAACRQCEYYRREILPDARETLRIAQIGYEQGELTWIQLLTAQRSWSLATREYIDSLRNLECSVIRIEGMLLSGGLDAVRGEDRVDNLLP